MISMGADWPIILLITAMIQVESGGRDTAVGDAGASLGPLQISRAVVADVNRVYGRSYIHHIDCFNREKSVDICILYLQIWANEEKVGQPITPEIMARIWNGGPDGWKQIEVTQPYWDKVSIQLAQIYHEPQDIIIQKLWRRNSEQLDRTP